MVEIWSMLNKLSGMLWQAVAVAVVSPSVISLLLLWRRSRREKPLSKDAFQAAVLLHCISAFTSPGLLIAYVAYVSLTCSGGGCGSGVLFILVLPFTYLFWLFGINQSGKAFANTKARKK
jgi:hypothetical protein